MGEPRRFTIPLNGECDLVVTVEFEEVKRVGD